MGALLLVVGVVAVALALGHLQAAELGRASAWFALSALIAWVVI